MPYHTNKLAIASSYLTILAVIVIAVLIRHVEQQRDDPPAQRQQRSAINADLARIDVEAGLPTYIPTMHATLRDEEPGSTQPAVMHDSTPRQPAFSSPVSRPPAPRDEEDWHVNLASFGSAQEADALVTLLRTSGLDAAHDPVIVNGTQYWRVYVQHFRSRSDAQLHAVLISKSFGLKDYWISRDS